MAWGVRSDSPISAEEHSQRAQNPCIQVHLALFPILAQGSESDWRQHDEKRSALRQVLVQVEQIDHGRHQNDATPDAEEAHQHTTPSPSRRMMNVIVTGQFRAYGLDKADQALLFSTLRPSAATSLKQAVTFKNGLLFLFAGTCYITCLFTSALRPTGGRAAARNAESPKT